MRFCSAFCRSRGLSHAATSVGEGTVRPHKCINVVVVVDSGTPTVVEVLVTVVVLDDGATLVEVVGRLVLDVLLLEDGTVVEDEVLATVVVLDDGATLVEVVDDGSPTQSPSPSHRSFMVETFPSSQGSPDTCPPHP